MHKKIDAEEWLRKLENDKPTSTPSSSPFFHSDVHPAGPVFIPSKAEKIVGQGNSQIVFGRDRSGNLASGQGAFLESPTIDIVVGRGASSPDGGVGTLVHNNFFADAARIYVSKNTRADRNFDLAQGSIGHMSPKGCSAIVLKADNTRIIGRGGIKIITGKAPRVVGFGDHGETLSTSEPISAAPPIDLIAGNYTGTETVKGPLGETTHYIPALQPVIRGKNLEHGLTELIGLVGELWSAVFNLSLIQAGFNGVIGVDPWRPWVAAAAIPTTTNQLTSVINSLYHTRANAIVWQTNYLSRAGYKYICSPNVNAT